MTASFFRDGRGHSLRGEQARERGARAWSRLPKRLRRDFTSEEAQQLRISNEWHHTGKHANRVHVYYPEQVQAFWDRLDADGIDPREWFARRDAARGDVDTYMRIERELRAAQHAAEEIRTQLEEENE